MIVLPDSWKKYWQGKDLFECVLSIQGDEYRNMDGRRTLRFDMLGNSYFAKLYSGIGWVRILKSLLTLRMPPVLSARNEWLAIEKLTELGIETMTIVGYGSRGMSPATQQSFLVTQDLRQTENLEDFCRSWREQPPDFHLKRALIRKIAQVSRIMHNNGINHRDYYLCHFLLDISAGKDNLDQQNLVAYLIDLHRVQFRKRVPKRWLKKDLASLYFSSMEIGLNKRDFLRFIREYTQQPLPDALVNNKTFWADIEKNGSDLLQRYYRKYAR
jgi:heptose I phosphotransferase